jgi:hypothetical protein
MSYSELTESLQLEKHQAVAIYMNCCFSFMSFIVLLVIIGELGPIAIDAGILIKDAGTTLNDISAMIPEISNLIPEARNTTLLLGQMIPKVNQGMYILRQICVKYPGCHL